MLVIAIIASKLKRIDIDGFDYPRVESSRLYRGEELEQEWSGYQFIIRHFGATGYHVRFKTKLLHSHVSAGWRSPRIPEQNERNRAKEYGCPGWDPRLEGMS